MTRRVAILLVWLVLGVNIGDVLAAGNLRVSKLRCEYMANPLGVERDKPRLSWIIESAQRGQKQIAYHVLVADSREMLAKDRGNLWDSGKVVSDQSIQIVYDGKPLLSATDYYWKVRIWGKNDEPISWSSVGTWSMGILEEDLWQAKWLGYAKMLEGKLGENDPMRPLGDEGSQWIWFRGGYPEQHVGKGTAYFRRTFTLEDKKTIEWARFLLTADDEFKLYVNGKEAGPGNGKELSWRRPEDIDVTEFLVNGQNILAIEATNASNGPAGVTGRFVIQLENGDQIRINTDASWKTEIEVKDDWRLVDYDDAQWTRPNVFGQTDVANLAKLAKWSEDTAGPLFRKTFRVNRPVKSAKVYISGLGYYELRLNGNKAGDHVLDPAFTRYDKRVLYVTYDVTGQVKQGMNTLGVMLGNGWYNFPTRTTWNFDRARWRDLPKVMLQMHIIFDDGSTETINTDSSWKAIAGPVIYDSPLNGEIYDARKEKTGWDRAEYDDSRWASAEVVAGPKGFLKAQMMPPIKVIQTITPVKVTETKPGVFLFDMGQNFAGWTRIRVSGPAGTKLTIRYGEILHPDGTLDRKGIGKYVRSGDFQTDTYILKGEGQEIWEPRFTYHGFRYAEVTGYPGKPGLDDVTGRVVSTAFEKAGSFECSNDLLNKIQQMILWSHRSNFHGYPTDCPQREKNGWVDGHRIAVTSLYNFNSASLYSKWLDDFKDEQKRTGDLPGIIPTSGWGYYYFNGPGWGSGYVILPWYLHEYSGDQLILEKHYDGMKRYTDFLTSKASSDHAVVYHSLGDWLSTRKDMPHGILTNSYYYQDALIISKVAGMLGKTQDAEKYAELATNIRRSYNKRFYKGQGIYANGSQASLSTPIYQGLVEQQEKDLVVEKLVERVEETDFNYETGTVSTKFILPVLSDNGRIDVAYKIATQTTVGSLGYWATHGGTALWEDWTGEEGSRNHVSAFGYVGEWFYRYLAGINVDPEQPAFKHIVISPMPVGDLVWVKAKHESMYGTIQSSWQIKDRTFTLNVTIPVNTTATVYVPAQSTDRVTESGQPPAQSKGVEFLRMHGDTAAYRINSGSYQFVSGGAFEPATDGRVKTDR